MRHPTVARWVVTSLVAALLGVGLPQAQVQAQSPAPTGGCPPGIGIGLVDAVVGPDPRSRTYVVDQVDGGAVLTRRVRVCNGTSSETSVDLYPGAAEVEGGEFRVVEGRAVNELTGWTTVTPGRVTVPAGGSVLATARIEVPEEAEDGERYGVVLAALPARGGVVSRVGVRVYLAVGAEATRTDFRVESVQAVRAADGRPLLRAMVRNTGQRAVDPRGTLVLHDGPGGTSAGPFEAAPGTTIAPGGSAPVEVALDPVLAAGPWRAEVALRAAGVERRAEAVVTWPAAGAAPAVRARPLDGHDGAVGLAVALPLVLLVLLVLLLLRRRRRDERPAPATDVPGPVPGGPVREAAAALPPAAVPPAALPRGAVPAPRSAAVRRALAERATPADPAAAAPAPRS